MFRHSQISLCAVVFLGMSSQVYASTPAPLTATDLYQVQKPAGMQVSPDGLRAVFSLNRYDLAKNKSNTDLHVLELGSGRQTQLTFHPAADNQPTWSPDGRQLVFVSKRDGEKNQLQMLTLGGGEARQLTDLPVGVSNPRFFPDGKKILFSAEVPAGFAGDFKLLKDEKKPLHSAKVSENRMYRYWDHFLTDDKVTQFFAYDIQSGDIQALTPGWTQWTSLDGGPEFYLSPDGKQLALSAVSSKPPYNSLNFDVYLVPTDGSGKAVNLTEANPADDSKPVFSPDGRSLLYGGQKRTDFGNDNVKLTRFDLAKKTATVLAGNIDLSPQQWFFSKDSQMLYFLAEDKARVSLFSVPSAGGPVKQVLRQASNEQVQMAGPQRFALVQHGISQLPEIFLLDNKSRTLKQISQINAALQQNTQWGKVEEMNYPGSDGKPIQMFVIFPPNFDTSKRWPLLSLLHGGPHSAFNDAFGTRWHPQVFAAMGYVVIMPNFHGSTGFGEAFTASIHGDHATKPFFDSEAAIDYMTSRGYIDESRVAAAGGSYGGYLVSWIAGHSTKYKALVNHAGVYDLMAQFASDSTLLRTHAYAGSPWKDKENVLKASPAMFAENFNTPMLITHGEQDYRVPVTQGLALYGVLKGKGVDARLVYFPDENHWILKPQNSIYWYHEFGQWLERYLGKGPTE